MLLFLFVIALGRVLVWTVVGIVVVVGSVAWLFLQAALILWEVLSAAFGRHRDRYGWDR